MSALTSGVTFTVGFSVNEALVEDLRPVPAVCVIAQPSEAL